MYVFNVLDMLRLHQHIQVPIITFLTRIIERSMEFEGHMEHQYFLHFTSPQ